MITTDWSVGRIGSRCAVTGVTFAAGDAIVAAIYELPAGETFARRDFSPEAFRACQGKVALEPGGSAVEPFSFWQTTIRTRDAKKTAFVDDAVLVDFFERLSDVSEPSKVGFRYVLALVLMRKRLLKHDRTVQEAGVDRDGQPVPEKWQMTLTHPARRDAGVREKTTCAVIRPDLSEAQIVELGEQLGLILAGDESGLD